MSKKHNGPKILYIDIETTPILAYCWGIWDQNISLAQVVEDWSVLAFCAKWAHEDKLIYMDQRNARNVRDDKKLLQAVWKLLDECDIVVGQNSDAFDIKKLNARFALHGMKPPSDYRQEDTKKMASRKFAFTSNKLEYLSTNLNKDYTKQKNSGFSMWVRCLEKDKEAFKEMEKYNKYDVLALEELHKKLSPWASKINVNLYTGDTDIIKCTCGSSNLRGKGFSYTNSGKYQRYICRTCGKNHSSKINLLSKEKRKSLLK